MNEPLNDAVAAEVEVVAALLQGLPAGEPVMIYVGIHDPRVLLAHLGAVGRMGGTLLAVSTTGAGGGRGAVAMAEVRSQARALGLGTRLTLMEGDGDTVARSLAPDHADLIFVHTGPGYDEAREQILNWYPRLRHGGVLVGDRCHADMAQVPLADLLAQTVEPGAGAVHPGVIRVVGEMFPGAQRVGQHWVARRGRGDTTLLEATVAMRRHARERARAERRLLCEVTDVARMGQNANSASEAIAVYEQLTRECPGYDEAITGLADRLGELGLPGKVVDLCERMLAQRGGNAVIYTRLARAHAAAGDGGAASTYCKAAIRISPDYMPAWLTLVEGHLERGETARAAEALVLALRAAPPDAEVLSVLARMSVLTGDARAMRVAGESLEMVAPGHPFVDAISGALARPAEAPAQA